MPSLLLQPAHGISSGNSCCWQWRTIIGPGGLRSAIQAMPWKSVERGSVAHGYHFQAHKTTFTKHARERAERCVVLRRCVALWWVTAASSLVHCSHYIAFSSDSSCSNSSFSDCVRDAIGVSKAFLVLDATTYSVNVVGLLLHDLVNLICSLNCRVMSALILGILLLTPRGTWAVTELNCRRQSADQFTSVQLGQCHCGCNCILHYAYS